MRYRLTPERRTELIAAHIEEFGDESVPDEESRLYNARCLDALREVDEVFEVTRSLEDLDEQDVIAGEWRPGELVLLCDEYRSGHTTLEEVT